MNSSLLYKLLAGVLAILLVLGGAYAGKTIHDTQLEVDRFRNDEEKVQSQLAEVKLKLDKNQEFLQRLETDPDFADRVARQNLKNYAKPGELIYRFDVDPLTGAPTGNLDSAHPPANTPALGTGQSAATPHHK